MTVSFNAQSVHHLSYLILSFSLAVSMTIFAQSPWSLLCCIRLFKYVIITLHYITTVNAGSPTMSTKTTRRDGNNQDRKVAATENSQGARYWRDACWRWRNKYVKRSQQGVPNTRSSDRKKDRSPIVHQCRDGRRRRWRRSHDLLKTVSNLPPLRSFTVYGPCRVIENWSLIRATRTRYSSVQASDTGFHAGRGAYRWLSSGGGGGGDERTATVISNQSKQLNNELQSSTSFVYYCWHRMHEYNAVE